MTGLTAKRAMFVREYLVDLNAAGAYRRAGYAGDDNVCAVEGHRLLRDPKVASAIESAKEKRADKLEISADTIAQELAKIGFSDVRNLFDENGNLKRINELDDRSAAAISSIEVVTRKMPGGERDEVEHVAKIKLWDKKGALVDLGRHVGMFEKDNEQKGRLSLEAMILQVIEQRQAQAPAIEGEARRIEDQS